MKTDPGPDSAGTKWNVAALIKPGIFVLLVAATVAVALTAPLSRIREAASIRQMLEPWGAWAYAGYVAVLIVAEALWIPRMLLITAGGLVFGPLMGGLLSVIADLAAGSAFYWLAASLARPAVERMLQKHRRTRELVGTVGREHAISSVALLRVCPLAHYTVFSYACGLSSIPFKGYFVGSFLGVLPGACIYPFFGNAVLNPGSPTFWFAAGCLVAFLVGTVWIGRKMLASAATGNTSI